MPTDKQIKEVITQITAVKLLISTETRNGITIVKKASKELGEFATVGSSIIAIRYLDFGVEKAMFDTEDDAIGWLTEKI